MKSSIVKNGMVKNKPVKNIPVMDLMSFLLETPDSPKHIGGLQIFKAAKGQVAATLEKILHDFHGTAVAPPFNYIPVFPSVSQPLLGAPKWAECHAMDMSYHIRKMAVAKPGSQKQLLDLITDLHAGMLDRSQPGWILYLIEGLEDNQFAIYSKVQHAYIDGASAVMRMDAALATSAKQSHTIGFWASFKAPASSDVANKNASHKKTRPRLSAFDKLAKITGSLKLQRQATSDVLKTLLKTAKQAGGLSEKSQAPLPFSAPKSMFNREVHAQRRLGVGSLSLTALRGCAHQYNVSINELVLSLVGDALERYAKNNNEAVNKSLVAVCPMGVRQEGNTDASTQIAALAIKLGEPGVDIKLRLQQVHQSSSDAKQDAQAMSREALMSYMVLVGGLAELLDRPPFSNYLPPLTNVNVSNVRGPIEERYICGAKLVKNIPLSTLAGGTAINITFFSMVDRMEYAIIADAKAVSDAQQIADYIESAFSRLNPPVKPKKSAAANGKTKTKSKSKPKPTTKAKAKPEKKLKPASKSKPAVNVDSV